MVTNKLVWCLVISPTSARRALLLDWVEVADLGGGDFSVYRLVLFLTVAFFTAELKAQDAGEPVDRADEITAARLQKAQTLDSAQTQTQTQAQTKTGFLKQAGHVLGRVPLSFEVDGLGPGHGGRINYSQWWRNAD